jgi:hypothetical protein
MPSQPSRTRRCRQQPPATALADAHWSSSTGFAAGVLGLLAAVPELIVRCENMRSLALLILLLSVLGCNQSQHTVAGPYRLEQFERKFYLEKAGVTQTGGGCIEGTVEEIGWTNGFIFAKRYATCRGDPDGWMIIEVNKQSMTGPLTEPEFRRKYPSVRTEDPNGAWKKL